MSQLTMLLGDAAELGAKKAIGMLGIAKTTITKSQAEKLYGKTTVTRWIKEGLVTPKRDGSNTSPFRIEINQIDAISKSSNRHSFLKTKGL
ncbi:hypothetical protein ACJVDH_00170 [Pedobacter sp. AW1-32]|uniref:hypothetical protein n=1 Tax=Pedobacter sp. AW1-32 TaxID=3383026 RepID=UPI003FF0A441